MYFLFLERKNDYFLTYLSCNLKIKMTENKRPSQTKYLKINDYLLYKDIEKEY